MFFSLVYIESKRETDKGKRKEQLLSLIFRNTNIAGWSRYAVRILTSDKRWINEFSRIGIYKRRRHIIGAPPVAEFLSSMAMCFSKPARNSACRSQLFPD